VKINQAQKDMYDLIYSYVDCKTQSLIAQKLRVERNGGYQRRRRVGVGEEGRSSAMGTKFQLGESSAVCSKVTVDNV
jgi:hypothetical protein